MDIFFYPFQPSFINECMEFSDETASTSSYECLCPFSECTLGFPFTSQMISNRMTMLLFAGKACVYVKQKKICAMHILNNIHESKVGAVQKQKPRKRISPPDCKAC